jgi:hypothetical protein
MPPTLRVPFASIFQAANTNRLRSWLREQSIGLQVGPFVCSRPNEDGNSRRLGAAAKKSRKAGAERSKKEDQMIFQMNMGQFQSFAWRFLSQTHLYSKAVRWYGHPCSFLL